MKNKRSDFVKSTLLVVVAVWCVGIFFATPVAASGVEPNTLYQLFDHPDAGLFKKNLSPGYGLRLDFIPGEPGPTFSVSCVSCGGAGGPNAFVTLMWNGLTAVITGSVWNWLTGEMWTVSHTMSTSTDPPNFTSDNGVLTLTDPNGPVYTLDGKSNGVLTFAFLADGYRLPDDYTIVGRGWFVPTDKSETTNDWIVTAKRLPEPSTLFLLGSGLLGLVFFRKRLE